MALAASGAETVTPWACKRGGEAAGNFRGVAQVDADADDQPVQVLAGGGSVDQDARELGAADEHIVRPFQHCGRGKELLDRFGDRYAGQE